MEIAFMVKDSTKLDMSFAQSEFLMYFALYIFWASAQQNLQ